MVGVLFDIVMRQVAVALHARAATSTQVRPVDRPGAWSGSDDAVRILLLGSGVTSGWGVHTHGLALVGWLQQMLQDRLNRPVDVEQVSAVGATLADATALLGDRAAQRWDAIVVGFGLSDAMRLTPSREWAQGLDRLLARLDGDMPQGLLVPVVIAGIPPTEAIGLSTPWRSVFRAHPEKLNRLTEQAVARNRRTVFVPLAEMADSATRPEGSPEAYRRWADQIADRVVPLIPADGTSSPAVQQRAVPAAVAPPAPGPVPQARDADPQPSGASSGRAGRRARLRTDGRDLTLSASRRSVPGSLDVRIQGPDPIRVLVVGGEYAVGFGTEDRADALDGALARLLHVRTGRGVVVENRSRHLVRLEQLAGSLGPAGAHTFDLVVWTPTFIEAARLLLRSRWVAGIGLMLRRIQTTSDAAVVLVGVPALVGAQPLAVVGRARALQINRLLRGIARRYDRVVVVEPPAVVLAAVDVVDGAKVYHDAAVRLLPAVVHLLDADRPARPEPLEDGPVPARAGVDAAVPA